MKPPELETLLYRGCRSLDGQTHPVDVGRRNGRPIPILNPTWTTHLVEEAATASDDRLVALLELICINLNPLERRTWLSLLEGLPIAECARQEGVSRAAIYERLRGKSGCGGMVSKNVFVAYWWRRRKEQETP